MSHKMGDEPFGTYTQIYKQTVNLGDAQVEFFTKPGLPRWHLQIPANQLFVEQATLKPGDSLLIYGCYPGVLASYLASHFPVNIVITDHHFTCLELTRMTLEANQIQTVEILGDVSLPEDMYGNLNVIFIQIPKGRMLARRWLTQAYHALCDNGTMYLVGSNQAGIQSIIKDAHALFGNSCVLGYKKGNRIAQFSRQNGDRQLPSWADLPGITANSWVEFHLSLHGHDFCIHSLPGVFSFDRLDEGTRLLLDAIKISPGTRVLDVGCGYGIIGLFAVMEGAEMVHLVDNDLLSVASCRETLAMNGIRNAEVFPSDLLESTPSVSYDLILSNPPFHAGHAVEYQIAEELIRQSYQNLVPGGRLVIVANRFLRYDRLISIIFGNVTTLIETGKYHVLSGLKYMKG
jgi:16S rRNA (guanine1207-N2)-methyltransferase